MTNFDYLCNANAVAKFFGKNHRVDRKLNFKVLEGATVLPTKNIFVDGQWTWGSGGIVDNCGEFVKESFVHYGAGDAYTPTDVEQSSATVVYLGMFYPVWGHCVTDNIRRLWFLQSDAFKEYFKDCALVYVAWRDIPLDAQKNFCRLLELLDVDISRLQVITRPTRFENVILPDESFFATDDTRFFTDEYRETIARVKSFALKNRTPSPEKIYFFYGANQLGEERLANYFHAKGYAIVRPEDLTLEAQLNVLINAKSFASTLGSSSHNSIFLRDGTDAIWIPRAPTKFTGGYQQAIDQAGNLNVTYIDSSLSIFEAFREPHCYIVSRGLKNFFGDDFDGYADDDLKTFAQHIKDGLTRGLAFSSDAENYYDATLTEVFTALKRRPDLTAAYGLNLS